MQKNSFAFKRAATIKVPEEFFNPIRTGMKDIDEAWSEIGGIVPSQVTFITGNPGAGKTTLSLAIGACLSKEMPVAFISLEMSDFQLAHQAKKIPGFGGVDVSGDFDQVETLKAIRQLKPGLIILDSIQKAARKMKDENGKNLPFDRAQFEIVNMFTQYAKETWTPVMLIGHCDKSGNYKGPSELLHDVDSHLLVHYDKEMDLRTFTFGKNRFGGVVQESLFGITSSSVWVGSPYLTTVFGEAAIQPQDVSQPLPEPSTAISRENVLVCITNLEKKWDGSTARATINAFVEYLKAHDPDFAEDSIVKDPRRVKVQFRGNSLAHCHPRSGELVFGKKTFKDTMEIGKVGYAKEQKFLIPRVKTKAQLLLWVIVHEWCHLYEGMQHHKNEFFEKVAEKYDWLQEQLQD